MPIARSKAFYRNNGSDIHALVSDWYQETDVPYVAHAVSQNGTVTRLRDAISAGASNMPTKHPDQKYWKVDRKDKPDLPVTLIEQRLQTAAGAGGIVRIEIDCKLMPCFQTGNTLRCMYQVPTLLRNLYGLNNTTLWIFSHADEAMGGHGTGHGSSKRVIICNTGNTATQLEAAYNNHDGWGWTT